MPQQSKTDFEICDGAYLRDLAEEAVAAIVALWDPELKTFWRSTDHKKEKGHTKENFFPTVTIRCIEALLRYVEDFSRPAKSDIRTLVIEACSALLEKDEKDLHSTLGLTSGAGMLNPFTLSLYVAVLSKATESNLLGSTHRELALSRLRIACGHLLNYSPTSIGKGPEVHPFVLFHVVRSAIAAQSAVKDTEIKSNLHELVSRTVQELETPIKDLLAKHTVGLLNPSEAVALAFCAACLEFLGDINDESYAASCLRVSTLFQDTSGCWPLGRLVPENEKIRQSRDLQIPTYEIAWAVTEAVSQMLAKRRQQPSGLFVTEIFRKLELAAKYAAGSAVTLEGPSVRGWCSDHAYGKPMIESWTSATVLQQALSMSALVEERNRAGVISKFSCIDPHDADWPSWLHWDTFKKTSEPEEACKILDYLERKLIQPILEDPSKLPRPQNKNMSALLFGPPGTSKTTVAKALAQKLDWPIVMLSPGTFIERGLEYIEAQAKIVFDQLLQLARTVVLFDECDELFRDLGIKHYQAFQTEHERAIRAEALAREAKLHALRNQLNPHFLFNTLNAVSTLTIQNNPIAANRMIGQLAAFLRMTLEEGNTTELPLSREVSMTEQYLQIEKARLGERLELQLAIAPEVRDALVPNMLLQPIVENAIRHGIAPATAGGKLTIQANQVDGRVQIRITDDGIGMKVRSYEDGTRRGGMGLATTIERLRVLYGNDHRFAVRWPQQGGCQVEIELPIHVQGRVLQDRSGVWIGNVSGVSRSQAQRT